MIEKDSDEATTCLTYTPTEDWDLDMEERFNGFEEVYETYKLFIDAGNLTNCLSLKEQLQPLTHNRKIHIDISCDVNYFFDEHFFDVRFGTGNTTKISVISHWIKRNCLDQLYLGCTEDVIEYGLRITEHCLY